MPHRPERPEKLEGGIAFEMVTDFEPSGDQPTAIKELSEGLHDNERSQVLLGLRVLTKPTLWRKLLRRRSGQHLFLPRQNTSCSALWEFKQFYPNNAVEYFVSYYDYYRKAIAAL